MAWYNTKGKENDVVVSSRIRFARNIADYPFESRLDETSCKEIIEKVTNALGKDFTKYDMADLKSVETGMLVEDRTVSPNFAKKKGPRALLKNEEKDVSCMVCEEDHIRLQCILPGLDIEEAYKRACVYDDMLDEKLNIAFDGKLGYLTHCPTNLGLGMRASVMLFLPALTMHRSIETLSVQLSKLGFVIRGMYGEGSSSEGCLYQISNSVTMGVTEDDTINRLNNVVKQICDSERKAREVIKSDSYSVIADRVGRAYGILKYAAIISSKEFMKLFADVRLGIALGLIKDLDYEKLGELMIGVMPATLIARNGGVAAGESERDVMRADYIRKTIG